LVVAAHFLAGSERVDVLATVALDRLCDGGLAPRLALELDHVLAAVDPTPEPLRLLARRHQRPGRSLADGLAPLASLEGVVEDEGLAARLRHAQGEPAGRVPVPVVEEALALRRRLG